MRAIWIAVLAMSVLSPSLALAGPKKLDKNVIANVSFQLAPAEEAELVPKKIEADAIFAIQKLRPVRSGVSTEELKIGSGMMVWDMSLPSGTRLLRAGGEKGREFYCGAVSIGKVEAVLNGKAKQQWLCFEDTDKDGKFDQGGYTEANPGAALPSFVRVPAFYPASFAYTLDAEDATAAYETAVEYRGTANLADNMVFRLKVRAPAQTEWVDATSNGVQGGIISISSKDLPKTVEMDGKSIMISAREGDTVSIKVDHYRTGTVGFGVFRSYR